MAKNDKKGLGRGFSSLIPETLIQDEFDPTAEEDKRLSSSRSVLIQDVVANPDQPRRNFTPESITDLAESVKEHGVLQPIIVVRHGDKYRIIAGERRWRAAQEAGLDKIPALVRELSDQAQLEISLIENIQREDLSPLEMATAFIKLAEQFNMTTEDIGKRIGKAASTVSNVRRLLKLPDAAKRALNELRISEQHARAILALDGDEQKQQELLDLILRHSWSATRAEQFVIAYKQGASTPTEAVKRTQRVTPETKLVSERLKTPVSIRRMAKGSGRLIIEFKDEKDYDRITGILGKIK